MPALAVKPTPPAAPSALSATAVSSSQINLRWQDNSGNESGFRIERASAAAGPWSQIGSVGGNVTSYSNTGLAGSTTWHYRVRAYNSRGYSSYAGPVSATTFPASSDATPPTVSLTAPANGSTVSGTITLSANASDNVGVTRVEFYRDGAVLVGTDTASPYSVSLNTTTVANGSHTFSAKAYDAVGNVANSATVTVTVSNTTSDTTPPSVSLTAPINGSTVSGTITLSATASDNVGVTRVEFYRDGTVLVGTDTASPYSVWLNTTTVANGSHTLSAKAYDAAGNVANSATVGVTVSNATADTTPPSISLTAPVNGSTVSGTITLGANASDNIGVTKVEFYCDSSFVGSDTASPYSVSFNTASVANGGHSFSAKAYDAANNVANSAAITVTVNNCAFSISPTTTSVVAAGGSGTVTVTATAGCAWTAVSAASWITVNFGSSGVGNGTVYYSVAANTGASSRAGTITIAGQPFTVNQAAAAGDTTAPVVTLTAPTAGSTVSGTITLAASASDNVGVTKVEFYCDQQGLVGTDTAAPYSVSNDTTTDVNGPCSYWAKAYDAAGNSTTSAPITVTVNNTTGTPGQLQWAQTGLCVATSGAWPQVATDRSGNVVLAGYFQSAVDFGSGGLISAGGLDAFIARYSPHGALLWAKRLGAAGDDPIRAVATDSAGNIIVAGYFSYSVDFGGVTRTSVPNPYFGSFVPDAFVAKYSANGSLLWVNQFGGTQGEYGYAVAVDGSDNILVATVLESANVAFGSFSFSTAGGDDIVLAKLSAQGTVLWAKRWGGANNDQPRAIAVDRSGDLVVSGAWGGGDLGGGSVAGGTFVAKYSGVDGSYRWANLLSATVNGVAADPNTGNVIIAGTLGGPVDFGTGPTASGGIFLAAYSSGGANLWAKTFNTAWMPASASDSGNGVAVDNGGNIALTGRVNSTINFGAGWLSGGANSFVAVFDNSGAYTWARRVSGSSSGIGVAFDPFGNTLSAGNFTGTVDLGGVAATTASFYGAPFIAQYAQ